MKRVAFLGTALIVLAAGNPSLAADMPLKAPPAPVVDPWNWTGFYVGGNVGYSWGDVDTDFTGTAENTLRTRVFRGFGAPIPTLLQDFTVVTTATGLVAGGTDMNGWLAGAQAGFNWQTGRWVFGIEADIQATGQDGDHTLCVVAGCAIGTPFATVSYSLDWFGTLRGRLGLAYDRYLFYGTGGLAVGHISTDYIVGFNGGASTLFSTDSTRTGWVAGGGVEAFINRNWTAKVEALYMDLGDIAAAGGGATAASTTILPNTPGPDLTTVLDSTTVLNGVIRSRITDLILRAGVNYKF